MKLDNHIPDPDRFYDELNEAHAALDEQASADLNARLVLILANQIGDNQVLSDCVALAAQVA